MSFSNRMLRALSAPAAESLRPWLERALQLDNQQFHSAREANDALKELWGEPANEGAPPPPILHRAPQPPRGLESEVRRPQGHVPRVVTAKRGSTEAESFPALVLNPHAATDLARLEPPTLPVPRVGSRVERALRWAAVAAAVLAVGEAVLIGRLLYPRLVSVPSVGDGVAIDGPESDTSVLVDAPAGRTPLPVTLDDRVEPNRMLSAGPAGDAVTTAAVIPSPRQSEIPVAAQRSGGFRLSSAVEVHVLDGERVVGSSKDGPIVVAAGRHEFEFVNNLIGYRTRHVVDIKPGQISPLSITVPNGIVNINALPWAEVLIDGKSFGETPIGNLAVAPGEHEIVFRHPELGERRQKAIVRTDVPTRISANLQQPLQ